MESPAITETGSGVLLSVWVVPGASRAEVVGLQGDRVKIRVTAPPEVGKANRELIKLLESEIGARVTLTRGMSGRRKVFEVAGMTADDVSRKLGIDV